MAERERRARIDQPREGGRRWSAPAVFTEETFGVLSEKFARYMGTPYFLIGMTVFVAGVAAAGTRWPRSDLRFDPYAFIFLTLMLSLQASYAAPLILLAQNRQADRDRFALEQDRSRDERNLADTEFLTREVAALRIACATTPRATSCAASCGTCSTRWRSAGSSCGAGRPRPPREAARAGASAGAVEGTRSPT